jgi:hypothetical protein
VADLELALKIIGGAAALVVSLLAVGRWTGSVSGKLSEIAKDQSDAARTLRGLGRALDTDREKNRGEHARLWMAHAQTSGRVDGLEMRAGLPPPWKRTQPIVPVDPTAGPPEDAQDMFAPSGAGDDDQ